MGQRMCKGQEELQWNVAVDMPVIKSWIHCIFLVIVLVGIKGNSPICPTTTHPTRDVKSMSDLKVPLQFICNIQFSSDLLHIT